MARVDRDGMAGCLDLSRQWQSRHLCRAHQRHGAATTKADRRSHWLFGLSRPQHVGNPHILSIVGNAGLATVVSANRLLALIDREDVKERERLLVIIEKELKIDVTP